LDKPFLELRYPQIDSLVSNRFVHKISLQWWFWTDRGYQWVLPAILGTG
jgi:hypothetical protein